MAFRRNAFIIREALMDTLALISQDTHFLVDRIIENLEAEFANEEEKNLFNIQVAGDKAMLSYILWETLKENRIYRTIEEIAYLMESPVRNIRQAEKRSKRSTMHISPSAFADRMCSCVQITWFPMVSLIRMGVEELNFEFLVKPQILIGAVILITKSIVFPKGQPINEFKNYLPVIQRHEREKCLNALFKISKTDIGAAFDVYENSVLELAKRIERENRIHRGGRNPYQLCYQVLQHNLSKLQRYHL